MGLLETVLRAAVADFTPASSRGFAYGIFNTAYGAAWFAGSIALGALYSLGILYAATFMILMQAAAVPVLWSLVREGRQKTGRKGASRPGIWANAMRVPRRGADPVALSGVTAIVILLYGKGD